MKIIFGCSSPAPVRIYQPTGGRPNGNHTAWPEPWQACYGRTTYPQCWYRRDPHMPSFWYKARNPEVNLDVKEREVEAAASAIYRWTRHWWQARSWNDAGVTIRGRCRLIAWAALAAERRAQGLHPSQHVTVAPDDEGATTPMART